MKKTIYIIVSIVIPALIIVWLLFNKNTAERKVYRHNKLRAVLISTDTASLKTLSGEVTYTGTFEPFREGKVMTESQGKIIGIHADLGDNMQAGQIVAQLDNELLKLQLEGVNVQIEGLEKDLERYIVLTQAEAVQGIQLEKTQLALEAARVQRKTVLEQIRKTTITAPFSGVVTQKLTELGTVISPAFPIVQLTDISSLKMTINIPESDLKDFKLNQPVSVSTDTYPEMQSVGRVMMIGSRGDVAHNYPVQIRVTNTPDLLIKAGMFGSVKMITGNNREYVAIPIRALYGSSLKQQVFVVENGKAVARDITVAMQDEKYAAISHGLRMGEIVITGGFINLKNGSPVKTR
ncbi:MAG: efflux RND transporter periplasmic adaptor subunit [Bacteroidales bacterium]|nr:efflux RND transporter periplasmic adaptor subunit [Bacteroidales bacterium]